MTDPVEKEHFLETIKTIRKALDYIEQNVNEDQEFNEKYKDKLSKPRPLTPFGLDDLLCRVGELESCIQLNYDLKNDPESKAKPNRLCTHYDQYTEPEEQDLQNVWVCMNDDGHITGIFENEKLGNFVRPNDHITSMLVQNKDTIKKEIEQL